MDLNACLNRYYESKIKINRNERTDALEVWQNLVEEILDEVKRLDPRFSLRIQYTGSFYERVKTESPDEFDLMLVLEKIAVNIEKRVLGKEAALSIRVNLICKSICSFRVWTEIYILSHKLRCKTLMVFP